jgi:calcium-translocating P-type ATPase
MRIQQLTADEAAGSLRSRRDGLTAEEARQRLREYGPNEVERAETRPWSIALVENVTHFFAIILWVAAGLAFVADRRDPGQGMATLGWAIVGVIVVNGAFSFWQEYRAERAVTELRKLLPRQVTVTRAGRVTSVPAAELVPGDVILLGEGDGVPADCRLVDATDLRVDMATVTGESLPQPRSPEPCDEVDLLHSGNVLLAGTSVLSGRAVAVVFATGGHTEFGKIARLAQAVQDPLSPLQKEIGRLSRWIAVLASAVGLAFFLIGTRMGIPFWKNFVFAIGVIVANVPEGLLPTVTLALAMGSQRMARRNALVRHLPAVETLGSTTVICTDKTGTLTLNRMAVRRVVADDRAYDAAEFTAAAAVSEPLRRVAEASFCCHSLRRVDEGGGGGAARLSGDPMEVALVGAATRAMPGLAECPRLGELPFDAARKRQTTLSGTTAGAVLYTKGALEAVLPLCDRVWSAGGIRPATAAETEGLLAAEGRMADEGLRVLAFAYRPVDEVPARLADAERGMVLCGLVGLEDPPRPEVPDAVRLCHRAGIRVIMVTGDHPHTAEAIARQVGLMADPAAGAAPVIVTGDRLRRMSDIQLQLALDAPEILFARVAADQKMRVVSALKRKGHVVAVTGDGVNDAPALRAADIGVAMGLSGTDVARGAADMVLLDDNFASIVAAVEEGRAVFANIRRFLTYILTSNVPELVPYMAFALSRIPLPLTVIQILAVDLGTDMLPALALGAQPPEPETMARPPRRSNARLLSLALVARAYLFLGVMEAAVAMAVFFLLLRRAGWRYGQILPGDSPVYRAATAGCLSGIVVAQVVNVFLCRGDDRPVLRSGAGGLRFVLFGVAVELLLIVAIDYTPVGQAVFGTAPVPYWAWLVMGALAVAMLAVEEMRKWVVVRVRARRGPAAPARG